MDVINNFIMNYCLVVVPRYDVLYNSEVRVLHATFYEHEPTHIDYVGLYHELKTNKEFGLTDRDDYVILPANDEMFNVIKCLHENKIKEQ